MITMKKYRKRPLVIHAIFVNMENIQELETLCGHMLITGTWLAKGIEGEFYPIAASVFDATYDEVKE